MAEICQMITKESCDNLLNSKAENKKIFFVNDLDLNSIFMITILKPIISDIP